MITDTTDIMIISQSELGVYDTVRTQAVYVSNIGGRQYVKFLDGSSCFLPERSTVIENYKGVNK